MWRAILVDDDDINLEILEKLLLKVPVFGEIVKYTNPILALEDIVTVRPDVVFLDIEMPNMNGLELAGNIMSHDATIKVVFITSYQFYAIEAFELYATDYILKPINPERLDKTLKRLMDDHKSRQMDQPEGHLIIKTFGKLEVSKGQKSIKWQGAKTEELFAFLVCNYDKSIHKDLIIETLWPDYDYKRALANMQTALYRVRQCLKEMGDHVEINYQSNYYRVVFVNVDFDLLEFVNALQDTVKITEDKIPQAKKATELYSAHFLEENGYIWSYAKQVTLEKKYRALVKKIIIYKQKK